MSDNENEYEEIKYYNREPIARGQSSTSKRNNNLHSPRYDYSLETNFAGEITIRRLHTSVPSSPANETVSYKNERKSNKPSKGQPSTKQQAIEIETINDVGGHNDDDNCDNDGDENTHNTNTIPNNEIQLQCLECIRSQQNSRQEQLQQQQYATEYSEPSSPKKKSVCAPIFQHVIFRMAILTVFFVILSFLCFINIYLFIFIFVSIVVVIFVNMGAQDANEAQDEQFEE